MGGAQNLSGITIAVPESRELEMFARMLEQEGASVVRCPLVSILDAPDQDAVLRWLKQLIANQFQDLILLTGEGLRRLLSAAQRNGLDAAAVDALKRVRKITRGPKPAKALREVGLQPDLPAALATTPGIIETLRPLDLRERNVGVQLYGEEPNLPLMDFLKSAGAQAFPVAPYVYAPAAHDEQVLDLVRKLAANAVQVIAFTSASQAKRLFEVAEAHQMTDSLVRGMAQTKVAAVGPVVADELKARNIRVDVMPQTSYFMRPLLKEIAAALGR